MVSALIGIWIGRSGLKSWPRSSCFVFGGKTLAFPSLFPGQRLIVLKDPSQP